jgi:hypothetical protein
LRVLSRTVRIRRRAASTRALKAVSLKVSMRRRDGIRSRRQDRPRATDQFSRGHVDVDLIFYDTTSLHFEINDEEEHAQTKDGRR